jgi:hypothetical protein
VYQVGREIERRRIESDKTQHPEQVDPSSAHIFEMKQRNVGSINYFLTAIIASLHSF